MTCSMSKADKGHWILDPYVNGFALVKYVPEIQVGTLKARSIHLEKATYAIYKLQLSTILN